VTGRCGRAEDIWLGNLKANRILFFGNSITLSPRRVPGTTGVGGWGMAASTAEKDYVHLVTGSIAQAAGGTPQIMATYNLDWEQNYSAYDYRNAAFQSQLAFKPDIVVVAIGENVDAAPLNTTESREAFATAFGGLLTQFKNNGNPAIFVRSEFWANSTKDGVLKQVTAAAGDVFVDQSGLDTPLNRASGEMGNPFRYAGGGVNAHPGDKGMKAIADSLYGAMVVHSVPEPGTCTLLGMGLIALLAYALRKKK
jgi:lysophospholipase L1-like esterase